MAFGVLEGMPDLVMDQGATQKLDFTYIEDAARGTVQLYQAANLPHRVYNLATGQAASIGHIIEIAKKYSHFPVEVEIGPGNLMQRAEALDISRAKADFAYVPEYSLEMGIKKYADWIRANKRGS
jgi:nucleoside-diphosphate-sugar epimerase